jgi:hypothetical protein
LLDQQNDINANELHQILLKIQLLMYQNKNIIDMDNELYKNTVNLLRIVNWEYRCGSSANEGDDMKYCVNFDEEFADILDS